MKRVFLGFPIILILIVLSGCGKTEGMHPTADSIVKNEAIIDDNVNTENDSISSSSNEVREIHEEKITVQMRRDTELEGTVEYLYNDHLAIEEEPLRLDDAEYDIYKENAGKIESNKVSTEDCIFWIPQICNMQDSDKEKRLNHLLEEESKEWLFVDSTGFESDLYIEFASDKYLCYSYRMLYQEPNMGPWDVEIYITIDIEAEKRVKLSDLVYLDDDFVQAFAQYCLGDSALMEYCAERLDRTDTTLTELKAELEDSSGEPCTQEKFIGYLLNHAFFYLRSGKLIIAYDKWNDGDVTVELPVFEEFLKVEPW